MYLECQLCGGKTKPKILGGNEAAAHGKFHCPPTSLSDAETFEMTKKRQFLERFLFETNVRIQRNPVYKTFHQNRCCGNETNC